jgi:hypothetical protein
VELYGFQQSLAKLQMSLEKAQGNYQSLSESRVQVGRQHTCQHTACKPCCHAKLQQLCRQCWFFVDSVHAMLCATCCRQSRRWRSCGRGWSRSSRPTSMKSSG